jgi:hypothetical protein
MIPISFDATIEEWRKKGIVRADIWGDVFLSSDCLSWLYQNVKGEDWYWDHFREEREVAIYFFNLTDALKFKLTWL